MSDSPVSYGTNGSIGVISINNPPVNALTQKVRQGISDALEESVGDNSKILLIMCQGRTFIAGAISQNSANLLCATFTGHHH